MPRVLIIDDDAASRTMLTTIARHYGFETVTAADGAEALQLIGKWKPDVVVLDLLLPNVNGFEVLRALKGGRTGLLPRTIVVTAATDRTLRDCKELSSVRAVLRKPFDLKTFVNHLHTAGIGPSPMEPRPR